MPRPLDHWSDLMPRFIFRPSMLSFLGQQIVNTLWLQARSPSCEASICSSNFICSLRTNMPLDPSGVSQMKHQRAVNGTPTYHFSSAKDQDQDLKYPNLGLIFSTNATTHVFGDLQILLRHTCMYSVQSWPPPFTRHYALSLAITTRHAACVHLRCQQYVIILIWLERSEGERAPVPRFESLKVWIIILTLISAAPCGIRPSLLANLDILNLWMKKR